MRLRACSSVGPGHRSRLEAGSLQIWNRCLVRCSPVLSSRSTSSDQACCAHATRAERRASVFYVARLEGFYVARLEGEYLGDCGRLQISRQHDKRRSSRSDHVLSLWRRLVIDAGIRYPVVQRTPFKGGSILHGFA